LDNSIHCDDRKVINKGNNHRLRNAGKIPGVVYGLNRGNMNVEFGSLDILKVLEINGEHGVVEIDLNGRREKVIVKETQRNPLTRELIHVDLQRIDDNRKITTDVPIVITGELALKKREAVVQKQVTEVPVECKPKDLPKFFNIDVSGMSPGRRITYNDIELSGEISIIGDMNTIIAAVTRIKENKQNDLDFHLDSIPPEEIQNIPSNS
jgi:large subunit ribosomal protein L25